MSPVSVSMSCIVLSLLRPRTGLFTARMVVALIAVTLIPAENARLHAEGALVNPRHAPTQQSGDRRAPQSVEMAL